MFTWICQQCGREVPPSYNDCPDCAAKSQPAQASGSLAPAPPVSPERQLEKPVSPAMPVAARPRPAAAQHHGATLPVWLLTLLFAFAFLGLGAGIYWGVGYFRGRPLQGTPSSTVESPAAKPGNASNPFQKFVEISGLRFASESKTPDRVVVKFMVTNHSGAAIDGLAGNVTIWGRTQQSEEDAQGTFSFLTDLKPLESKELSAPLTTKYKIYELPDWQNATADVQITAPEGGFASSPAPR